MAPGQKITGRTIPLVKNEFKINLHDTRKILGLWRVEIEVYFLFQVICFHEKKTYILERHEKNINSSRVF